MTKAQTQLSRADLVALREALGLTQESMAEQLGMSLRAFQAIEQGESKYRRVHQLAAERLALSLAVERGALDGLPASVRADVAAAAGLLGAGPR